MSLTIGSRLGPYDVLAAVGAGGMGVVYRGRDTRLGRDVALKVLPPAFLVNEDRRSRFDREARALAALNHPCIGAIYGVEEAGDVTALVLEFVDGDTLAETLVPNRGLPLERALAIARQIADALEAAHEKGIVHRDLKPANIKLTAVDRVKVLDFGLAKIDPAAIDSDHLLAPTMSAVAETRDGTFMGTAAYMSPEQARGRAVDKRADIWAFGCVLYELLTGCRAFSGETVSDTIAAVLERSPDWTRLPETTPAQLTSLLRRCLEKEAKRRLHDIADARIELDDIAESDTHEPIASNAVSSPARSRERVAWVAAALLLVALGAALYRLMGTSIAPVAEGRYHLSFVLPPGMRFTVAPPGRFELSPDGRRIAFIAAEASGRSMLWVRSLDSNVAQLLADSEGAQYPFWSSDSRSIAFVSQGRLKRIDATGGQPITLAEVLSAPTSASFGATGSWNRDGVILFTPAGGAPLFSVSASGGAATQVTTLDTAAGEAQHWYPSFLPDGKHFLYFALGTKAGGLTDPRGVYVGSLDGKEPVKLVLDRGSNAKYAQGRLFFLRGSTLMSQSFDVDRLELSGEPLALAEDIQLAGNSTTGAAGAFSVSQTGVLAYQAGSRQLRSQLTWFDRAGTRGPAVGDPDDLADVSLSPDGTRVATSVLEPQRGTRNLWLLDVSRGVGTPFTTDADEEFAPAWSLDGTRIVYSARRGGSIDIYEKPVGGEGDARLVIGDSLGKFQSSVSPSGVLIYVAGGGTIGRSDIYVLPLAGDRKPAPFLQTAIVETQPQFSPDGKWVAYTSADSGQFEVYVTPFPGKAHRLRVSPAGGSWPRWRRDGRELFYVAPDGTLNAVPVTNLGTNIQFGSVRALFNLRARPQARLDSYPYDVSHDGQRFLVNRLVEESPSAAIITLVTNVNAPAGK